MLKVYVMVSFWMGILAFIIRMLQLCSCEFPRTEEKTLGGHLAVMILSALFVIWAGLAIWG